MSDTTPGAVEVSIAIPFFNPGKFFVPALQSVFAQTFTDWELLLIDDGGTDEALRIAMEISDSRVRVIADGTNRGLSYRLNQAAHLARGKYLFRMDADDLMHPQRLEAQLVVLRSSSSNTVVGSSCYSIDQNGGVVGWRPAPSSQAVGFAARYSFVHPTVAAPTQWFRSNPYSEEHLYRRAEDAELWCRTSSFTEFKWADQPLLFYREVGVFSISNYLAGQEAILDLVRRMEHRPDRRRWLLTRERTKMILFRTLATLRLNNVIVRHRFRSLPTEKLTEAVRVVNHVTQTVLPHRDRQGHAEC